MERNVNQKIESGLIVLARIIARQEIKRQLASVDKLVIFPSIGDISNVKESIEIENENTY